VPIVNNGKSDEPINCKIFYAVSFLPCKTDAKVSYYSLHPKKK
jgi:hypothetical protein